MAGFLIVFMAAQAQSQTIPTRKPGLWEVVIRGEHEPDTRAIKVLQCTDHEAEAQTLMSIAPGQEDCQPPEVTQENTGHRQIRTVCVVHDSRVNTSIELSGDLDRHYSGTLDTHYSRADIPSPGRKVFEGRWLGECRPGMKPGDMLLPNGVTVNVLQKSKPHDHHPEIPLDADIPASGAGPRTGEVRP